MEKLNKLSRNELGHLFPVILVPYDERWKTKFEQERENLSEILGQPAILRAEHIGSTAIPTILSKPTIDLLIEIPENLYFSEVILEKMNANGYHYIPRTDPEKEPYMSFVKGYRLTGAGDTTYHIYMASKGHSIWQRVIFRDYLNQHPDAAREYNDLKIELCRKFKYDREAYTEGKTEFIRKIMKRAGKPIP